MRQWKDSTVGCSTGTTDIILPSIALFVGSVTDSWQCIFSSCLASPSLQKLNDFLLPKPLPTVSLPKNMALDGTYDHSKPIWGRGDPPSRAKTLCSKHPPPWPYVPPTTPMKWHHRYRGSISMIDTLPQGPGSLVYYAYDATSIWFENCFSFFTHAD